MAAHYFACFECGKRAHHAHHVVPRSLGGTRTVPLCHGCHGKVHEVNMDRRSLQKAGIAAAKARGVKFGRPRGEGGRPGKRLKVTPEQEATARRLKAEGVAVAAIASATGLTRPTVYSVLKG